MKPRALFYGVLFSLLFWIGLATACFGQHFIGCPSAGPNSSGIVLSATVDGFPLQIGDEIAAYTEAGVCAGVTTLNTTGAAPVPLFMDDPFTPEIDGFVVGDKIVWWFGIDLDDIHVIADPVYDCSATCSETFVGPDAIYVLTLTASTGLPITAAEIDDFAPSFDVFPQPASTEITVVLARMTTARIYDLTGRLVAQQDGLNRIRVNVEHLPPGVYILTTDRRHRLITVQ